jgi:hypothetical protein
MDLQGPSEPTPVNPLPETGIPKAEDVDTNTFTGVVTNPVQGGEKPYYIEDTGVPGPAIEDKPSTPGLIPLDKPQITFQTATTVADFNGKSSGDCHQQAINHPSVQHAHRGSDSRS